MSLKEAMCRLILSFLKYTQMYIEYCCLYECLDEVRKICVYGYKYLQLPNENNMMDDNMKQV